MEISRCPFCGKRGDSTAGRYPMQLSDEEWVFTHDCDLGELYTIHITVYGGTREETLEKWNKRARGY